MRSRAESPIMMSKSFKYFSRQAGSISKGTRVSSRDFHSLAAPFFMNRRDMGATYSRVRTRPQK